MKASELRDGEYGFFNNNVLVVKTDTGYAFANNHTVTYNRQLPFDMILDNVKQITDQSYIVQYDDVVTLTSYDNLKKFIEVEINNNNNVRHITITRLYIIKVSKKTGNTYKYYLTKDIQKHIKEA